MSKAIRKDGPGGRFYDVDGVLLPSVTHILSSAIAKPALIPWAAKMERLAVTEAAADLYQDIGASPLRHPRSWYLSTLHARLGAVRAHEKVLTTAGDLGTECHRLVEWTIRTKLGADAGPKPVVRDQARFAFRAFETWAASVRLKPVLVERVVHSTQHAYAGTMDLLARVNGELCVVDFKTGARIYGEAKLQLTAYNVAAREMGYRTQGPPLIVRLPKAEGDGFEVQAVENVDELFPVFMAAKSIWHWQQIADKAYRARTRRKIA